jgi:DNA repair exonuclease SbcCD ATPase subunit
MVTMISGRQALGQIEQAVAQLRREEARLDADLRAAGEEAARLRIERMESFRELARVKLDVMTRPGFIGDLDAAERQALGMIESRRRALDSFTKRRAAAERKEQDLEAERHARAEELEQALEALDELRARVERETRSGASWSEQRARIGAAEEVARQAEKKAEVAEADRKEKGRPYEADPLFTYLWRRKFGTAEYRAGNLVRFFDRRVARLVGYDKARANYTLLNEIPLRLREHAQRMKDEIAAERTRLTAVERVALQAAGAAPLQAAVETARGRLVEAEQALARAKADLAELDRQHDASVLQGDLPFKDAIELLAKADAAQDLRSLYEEARRTPTPQDDALVRRIETTEAAIGQAERRMGEMGRELAALAQRRSALEQEWQGFRRQGYDRPHGGFGNAQVIGSVLGGILGGVLQGTVLRDTFRDGYRREPGPWDSDFGDLSPFPQDGGWIGGGGGGDDWAGGGGGSIGGGGDDGFSTGGSI